jgi:hypothetical protein
LTGYGLAAEDLAELEAMEGSSSETDMTFEDDQSNQVSPVVGELDADTFDDDENSGLPDRSLVAALLSYCVGVAFGRWDITKALAPDTEPKVAVTFDSPPIYSPAMLRRLESGSGVEIPNSYPLHIEADGILTDDPEHPSDIVRRVRNVVEVLWQEQADTVERDACASVGFPELRAYFSRSGQSGFWDDHVKRYSKRPRKAPIYWLLQSSRKNYALWLYYHRLDKDLLFKALVNYVEPKIRLEDCRLETLRTQRVAAGGSGRDAKRLGKEVERQEEFVSELRDFEDKLRRVTNLHLEPDLNDGVVLNIAPLWEMVPWKEAKNYWEELLEGKYEWSSIAKQLREKELVK